MRNLVIISLTLLLGVFVNCGGDYQFSSLTTDSLVSKIGDSGNAGTSINDDTSNADTSINDNTGTTVSDNESSSTNEGANSADNDSTENTASDIPSDRTYIDDINTTEEEENASHQFGCETQDDSDEKVLVCHVPPGNPAARHEICISKNALHAHLGEHSCGARRHQDYLGYCDHDDEQDVAQNDDSDDFDQTAQ